MSGQHLIPTPEQLAAIVEKTRSFLDYLRDSALVEGAKEMPVPQATIAYRKGQAIYQWAEWEETMNPSKLPFEGPPIGMVAGGWPDWKGLHYALVDLDALRKELITRWGLAPVVGAQSVQLAVEAIGKPESGGKALFIQAKNAPSSGTAGHVRLEKPLDWPLPVPLDWGKQCRYVLKRIEKVMEAQSSTSMQSASNPGHQPMPNPPAITGKPRGELTSTISGPPKVDLTVASSAPVKLWPGENEGKTTPEQWTAGTFLAKAKELSRRLRSWHIEDFLSPIQFASQQESRHWVRVTFREITINVNAKPTPRPQKSLQLYTREGGEPDEGCVGEAYENPDRDTDRSLTMWLLGDFFRHLDTAPALPALDYLKESFGHLLDLPAWTIRGPSAEEPWPEQYRPDEHGKLRGYMVTGRILPAEFLQNLTDAAEKLLTGAPVDWMTGTKTETIRLDAQELPQVPHHQPGEKMSENRSPSSADVTHSSLPKAARHKVFISYSHKDTKFRDELLIHLKPLERAGLVTTWSDKQIAPGSQWFAEIQAALASTSVAVMLVTPNFLASDFIHEHELGPLLKDAEQGGVRILWIPVRAFSYKETALKNYQAVSPPDKPLAQMKAERDQAWVKVCDEIKKALAACAHLPAKRGHQESRIQRLILTLDVPEADDRTTAIRKLGEIGPEAAQALGPLLRAFQDPVENVRCEAGEAVLKMGQIAIAALLKNLEHTDPSVRGRSAGLLGRFRPPALKALPDLIKLLKDEDTGVRRTAVVSVGSFGTEAKEAVPLLVRLLVDPDRDTRRHVAESLGKISREASEAVLALAAQLKVETDNEVCYSLVYALGQIGPAADKAVHVLAQALRHENPHVRQLSAEALGNIGSDDERVVQALIAALDDDSGALVRFNAARSLGLIKSHRDDVLRALVGLLDTKDVAVAAWSLGELGRYATIANPKLTELAETHSEESVREAASASLKKINESTINPSG